MWRAGTGGGRAVPLPGTPPPGPAVTRPAGPITPGTGRSSSELRDDLLVPGYRLFNGGVDNGVGEPQPVGDHHDFSCRVLPLAAYSAASAAAHNSESSASSPDEEATPTLASGVCSRMPVRMSSAAASSRVATQTANSSPPSRANTASRGTTADHNRA